MWPRNAAENAQAAWAQVATYASQGISSGTPFDWQFFIDVTGRGMSSRRCARLCQRSGAAPSAPCEWTRASPPCSPRNHVHPWPEPAATRARQSRPTGAWVTDRGARRTTSTDLPPRRRRPTRVPTSRARALRSSRRRAVSITRATWRTFAISISPTRGENLPGFDETGQDPFYTRQMNDLLWAEGLIRSGGNKALAAAEDQQQPRRPRRVPALTSRETSTAELLAALHYEQEIEFMGQGPTPFFNRRRIDGLQTGTPRHMPVPAKEMDVLVREVYTFGGPGGPDMSIIGRGPSSVGGKRIRSVGEIWNDLLALRRADAWRRR